MFQKIKKYLRMFLAFQTGKLSYDTLFLNLTSICNSNCVYCEVRKLDASDNLNSERIEKLLEEAKDLGIKKVYFSGGEPFMHPDIWKFIEKTISLKLKLRIVSNGLTILNFDQQKIDLLKQIDGLDISLESYDRDVHNKLRGGDFFDRTVNGIKKLRANDINITINTVLSNKNYSDLDKFLEFTKELNANFVNFQPLHVWSNYEETSSVSKDEFSINDQSLNDLENKIKLAITRSKQIKQKNNLAAIKPWIKAYFDNQNSTQKSIWMKKVINGFQCTEIFTKVFVHFNGSLQPCAMLSGVDNIKDKSLNDALKSLDKMKNNIREGVFPAECYKCSCQMVPNYISSILGSPIKNFGKLTRFILDLWL